MERILVLCENIYYDDTSAGIVNTNILNSLREYFEVECLYIKRYEIELPDFYRNCENINLTRIDYTTKKGFYFYLNKIKKIRAIPAFFTGLNALDQSKIQNWFYYADKKNKEKKFSLILALGTGHEFFAHFAVDLLNTTVPKLLQIHDPFPLNVISPLSRNRKKIRYKKLQASFNKVLGNNNFIGFPSLELKNWMHKFYSFEDERCILLPHPESFLKKDVETLDSCFFDTRFFNLAHVGFLWDERDPSALLNAFQKFCNSGEKKKEFAHLHLIGKFANKFNHLSSNENLHLVKERITYKKSLQILKAATANILIDSDAEVSPILPGKFADYVIAGKPILALTPRKSEVSRLLGGDYKYKSEVNNEKDILSILNLLWNAWLRNKKLELDRPDLNQHISSQNIINSIHTLLSEKR